MVRRTPVTGVDSLGVKTTAEIAADYCGQPVLRRRGLARCRASSMAACPAAR